jgi:subtilisin family serine protease
MNGNPQWSDMEMADAGSNIRPGETTGAFLVLLETEAIEPGLAALQRAAGIEEPETTRVGELSPEELESAATVVFPTLGVAVVTADPDQQPALLAAVRITDGVRVVERERVVGILHDEALSADYLRGCRDTLDQLLRRVEGGRDWAAEGAQVTATWDESEVTWGLQATKADASCFTGRGVKVAVLDTGLDLGHRDIEGRSPTVRSFVAGEEAQDGHGHGTHCIGTACGKRQPAVLPRYGVATDAEIFAGKVLSNAGSGSDRGILAGIEWAVENGCRVVSMSLGAPVAVGTPHSQVFEQAADRALHAGTIIVAAAGNDSGRPQKIKPVSHPANCPSILAVAALTPDLEFAVFSNAGLNPNGGQIDIAATGVAVRSAWLEPTGYRTIAGTSMATPHVAGVLALLAEQDPQADSALLKTRLLGLARRLPLPATDVGAGIVQAPKLAAG